MKPIKFIWLLLFILSCEDLGDGYNWNDNYSENFIRRFGSKGYDYGWNITNSLYDNGLAIIGRRRMELNGQSDLWAIKTNSKGIVQWERYFGGSDNEDGYDVISTSDGGFIFAGYSWSFGQAQQMYAIKTDNLGNILWEKTYGGEMWESASTVIELSDGSFLLGGFSNSPGISSGNTDFYIVKINSNGEKIWHKSYGNKVFPNHEWAYDMIQLNDLSIIIVGARDRYAEGSKNAFIIRIDKNGNLIWEKELLGINQENEIVYSIAKGVNGYFYLCSTLNSSKSPDIFKPKIIKMDQYGNIEWERILESNGKDYHQYRAITTKNNEIVVVGSSGQELPIGYREDAFMTRLDSNGNIIWSYPYGSYDHDDWGWSLVENQNNDLILVGSTKSFGASLFDIFIVGTNQNGIQN